MSENMIASWTRCLDDLSRRHYFDPVTVEVMGLDIGDQIEAKHAALVGLSFDAKDRPSAAVSILLESPLGGHTERLVHGPINVLLKKRADGDDDVLAIEASDGTTTLVKFERDHG